jgi:sulfur carrier protein ThiS
MNIKVKLFGGLKKNIPEYKSDKGIELQLPEGSTVADVIALLKIPNPRAATAIMDGRVLKMEEKIAAGSMVNLFHVMYGG